MDFQVGNFEPVLSEIVAAEIADAPEDVQEKYAELLDLDPEMIESSDQAHRLAQKYQCRRILTEIFYNDGLHIALATIAEVDVLVSWDFRHTLFSIFRRFYYSEAPETDHRWVDRFALKSHQGRDIVE